MNPGYPAIKAWRDKTKKNKTYNARFMARQRARFLSLWEQNKITLEDIPESYRGAIRTQIKRRLTTSARSPK